MQLPIGIELYRGRYVHGFPTPAALTPGKAENYKFALPSMNLVFLPGHRIMVQVQSTLFPLYDRNPQTYVPNIFDARLPTTRRRPRQSSTGRGRPAPSGCRSYPKGNCYRAVASLRKISASRGRYGVPSFLIRSWNQIVGGCSV